MEWPGPKAVPLIVGLMKYSETRSRRCPLAGALNGMVGGGYERCYGSERAKMWYPERAGSEVAFPNDAKAIRN